MRASSIIVLSIVVIVGSTFGSALTVDDLKAKWENMNTKVAEINKDQANEASNGVSKGADTELATPVDPNSPQLTATLVAWISSQCENVVEEMEAIARQNAEFIGFSVVNYLRYLHLYDDLKVISAIELPQLKWVRRKAKVFVTIYDAAMEMVSNHLHNLDEALLKLEQAEPKSKQKDVSSKWLNIYESIRYIATHSPKGSQLAADAQDMLSKSPNNSVDKVRSTRYRLATNAFSR